MKYFVCSDIHGYYDEWQTALKQNGFDMNNQQHKIIICGDLFDRGHQPKEIIDFILAHKDKFIIIRGNHEDWMQEMIDRNYNTRRDLSYGTAYTIVDLYPDYMVTETNLKKIAKVTGLQEVLDMCVDYFETKEFVFVHGWIPTNNNKYDKNWRNATKKEWDKARFCNPVEMFKNKLFEPNKTIVCGHWYCSAFWHELNPNQYDEFGPNEKFDPFITKEMIAIDTCTDHTKKVNIIIINEKILKKEPKIQKNDKIMEK